MIRRFMFMILFTLLSLLLFCAWAFAVPSPLPISLPILDDASAALVGMSPALIAGGAAVIEVMFRLIKTPVPLSWAWCIAYSMHGLAGICSQISKLCGGGADLLDRVLPQKTSQAGK